MKCLLFTAAFETTVDLFLMNVQLEHTAVRSPGSCLLPQLLSFTRTGTAFPSPTAAPGLTMGPGTPQAVSRYFLNKWGVHSRISISPRMPFLF